MLKVGSPGTWKKKVMVFNSIDPCQEFVFKGDVIERVQTFKYMGILLETTRIWTVLWNI
jgi:hypothetical protein